MKLFMTSLMAISMLAGASAFAAECKPGDKGCACAKVDDAAIAKTIEEKCKGKTGDEYTKCADAVRADAKKVAPK